MVHALEANYARYVAAPTLAEDGMVVFARLGFDGELAVDALLQRVSVRTIAMTTAIAAAALTSFRRYGKRVRTPPDYNFGDCLCYGVAPSIGVPVRGKGDDSTQTDLTQLPE